MASILWTSGISNAPTVELIVTQQSQDISGNYSVLAYSLIIHRPYNVSSTASKSYSIKINNVTVANGTTTIGGSGDKTIYSGTTKVYHNSDGTKTGVPLSFYMDIGLQWSGSYTGNASGSGTMNLTTIPRASIGSLSDATPNLGDAITINIARASTAFTHDVYVDWYAGTWTKLTTSGKVATSLAWTVPKNYANSIPDSTSGNGRILIETYNGGTLIGSDVISFTASVPNTIEFKPTITQVAIAEAVAGLAAQFAAYVQSRSKLAINIAASGAYGSSITHYRTAVLGSIYNGNPVTTAELTSAGTIPIVVTVTDSRGRSATYNTSVSVVEYYTPEIENFNVLRATSAGVEDGDDGVYLKALMKFSVAPVGNKNTKNYKLEYKLQNSSTWSTLTTGSAYVFDSSYLSTTGILNLDFTYDVRLTLTDYFGSVSQIFQVSAGFTLLDFAANGRGLAIGKVYEGLAMLELFGDMLIQNRGLDTKLLLEQLQGNAGLEIGNPNLIGYAYIDFHSGGQGTDRDARIIVSGGDGADEQGAMDIRVKNLNLTTESAKVSGNPLWHNGVIEEGENANGMYTKFPDGTMICRGSIAGSLSSTSALGGGGYRTSTIVRNFPALFAEEPVVTCSMRDGNNDSVGAMVAAHPSNPAGQCYAQWRTVNSQAAVVRSVDYIAVGRWFL